MGHQTMGCYGGDETEAYEQQQQPIQMVTYMTDQTYHQSDYVEAVEGFTAEDDDQIQAYENQECHYQAEDEGEQEDDQVECYEEQQNEEDDDLEEDEYIEEEHSYTLNELYAQAHKQLLANGLGTGSSNDDIRAW